MAGIYAQKVHICTHTLSRLRETSNKWKNNATAVNFKRILSIQAQFSLKKEINFMLKVKHCP